MGVYIYTMRKDVKLIDGKKIARFSFAYKLGCASNRTIARLEAAAERAATAHPDVDYFFLGDWKRLEEDTTQMIKNGYDGVTLFKFKECSIVDGNIGERAYIDIRKIGRHISLRDPAKN